MSLASVLGKLQLSAADVSACYVVGSRAWGLAGKSSDTDVLVVLRGTTPCKRDVHAGGVDGVIVRTEKQRKEKKRKGERERTRKRMKKKD